MGTHPIFESDFDCLTDSPDSPTLFFFIHIKKSSVQMPNIASLNLSVSSSRSGKTTQSTPVTIDQKAHVNTSLTKKVEKNEISTCQNIPSNINKSNEKKKEVKFASTRKNALDEFLDNFSDDPLAEFLSDSETSEEL